jgi:pseudaminic acid synthase
VASKGKPVILSTGIAEEADIRLAIDACLRQGNDKLIVLKCTSSYPAPIDEANMIMVPDFVRRFGVISGLSDHTMGNTVPVVATTLGAKLIEKHFIMDRSVGGPDAAFSLNLEEFTSMVTAVREAEMALGQVDYQLTDKQRKSRDFSRSLYVAKDIAAGEQITTEHIRSVRPGYGMHPKHYHEIIGSIAKRNYKRGEPYKL